MSLQTIGIGAAPNDGTGDPLRDAFDKVNDNFIELYAAIAPDYVTTRYYFAQQYPSLSSGSAPGLDSIRFGLCPIFKPVTIAKLGCRVSTLSVGGNVQLAIYAHGSDGLPTGTALGSTGSMSTTNTGNVEAVLAGGNLTLAPGWYWFASNCDNGTAAFTICGASIGRAVAGSSSFANLVSGATTAAANYTLAQTFGTWPDVTASSITDSVTGQVPVFVFQVA